MGRSLSKETILPTWVERYEGLTANLKNGKPLGCGLDVGVGVQLTKGKGNFLYSAVSIPQKNLSTYKSAVRLHLVHRESYLTTKQLKKG